MFKRRDYSQRTSSKREDDGQLMPADIYVGCLRARPSHNIAPRHRSARPCGRIALGHPPNSPNVNMNFEMAAGG
ncbi:MAG: hypothetical protein D6709_03040 [Chloroflexi bacterium]|nr:MAG: hypothetical protein D6709_03040 [Chloroflexota bacterium]